MILGPALGRATPGSVLTEEIVRVRATCGPHASGRAFLFPSPAGERGVTLDSQLGAEKTNRVKVKLIHGVCR